MEAVKFPLALQPGSVLAGKYVLDSILGQGGFGITYKATEYDTGKKVAIKEYFPDSLATRYGTTVTHHGGEEYKVNYEYGMKCFLQEAETLASLCGIPGVVDVYCYFEENCTAYYVMDFLEGIDFAQYIYDRGGRLDYETTEKIMFPVMDALSKVHARGIIHRDISPDNIRITKDGTVCIIDFGAARQSLGDKSRSLDVVLKHGFAPKEQYSRRGRQGPFTDVYSCGAVFYMALTGKRPIDSIDRLDEDELLPLRKCGVNITPAKDEAIMMALSVHAQSRFQTMAAFKGALMATAVRPTLQQQVPNTQMMQNPAQTLTPSQTENLRNLRLKFNIMVTDLRNANEEKRDMIEIHKSYVAGYEDCAPNEFIRKDKLMKMMKKMEKQMALKDEKIKTLSMQVKSLREQIEQISGVS